MRFMKKESSFKIGNFIEMLGGSLLRGLGCGLLIVANVGSDPITTFNVGFAKLLKVEPVVTFIITNLIFIILLLFLDKKKIGIGTVFSTLMISQGVLIASLLNPYLQGVNEYVIFAIAIIISAIGISMYADANIGISALDGCVFALHDKIKIPIRYAKIGMDILFLLFGFLMQSQIGIGTIISLIVMGPLVDLFYKIIKKGHKSEVNPK